MDPNWLNMFRVGSDVLELVIRTSIIYLVLMVAIRVVGRREVGTELPDLLMILLVSEGVGQSLGNASSITGGLVVAATLLAWSYLLDWLVYRSKLVRKLLRGSPLKLIEQGRMIRKHMRREFISSEELHGHLRAQGIESVKDVKIAFLEPDGELSVIKYESGDDRPHSSGKSAASL